MSGIFISYRRDDTAGYAGRLYDALARRFGADHVFIDIDTLKPGLDFAVALNQAVASADVLLALIGPHWLSVSNAAGMRRLDDPDDFVRQEIRTALARDDTRVVPVLLSDTAMPSAEVLPDDLKPLARRHAFEISDERWDFDVDRLIKVLEPAINSGREQRPGATRWLHEHAVGIGCALLVPLLAFVVIQVTDFSLNRFFNDPTPTVPASDPAPDEPGDGIPISGEATGSADLAYEIARERGAERPGFTQDYLVALYEDAATRNINADVLVAQWDLETASGTSHYWVEYGNPAGLGVTGDPSSDPDEFTAESAARAHVVHMCAYLGITDLPPDWIATDPYWSKVEENGLIGSVTTTADLSGGWSMDPDYGNKIDERYAYYWGDTATSTSDRRVGDPISDLRVAFVIGTTRPRRRRRLLFTGGGTSSERTRDAATTAALVDPHPHVTPGVAGYPFARSAAFSTARRTRFRVTRARYSAGA